MPSLRVSGPPPDATAPQGHHAIDSVRRPYAQRFSQYRFGHPSPARKPQTNRRRPDDDGLRNGTQSISYQRPCFGCCEQRYQEAFGNTLIPIHGCDQMGLGTNRRPRRRRTGSQPTHASRTGNDSADSHNPTTPIRRFPIPRRPPRTEHGGHAPRKTNRRARPQRDATDFRLDPRRSPTATNRGRSASDLSDHWLHEGPCSRTFRTRYRCRDGRCHGKRSRPAIGRSGSTPSTVRRTPSARNARSNRARRRIVRRATRSPWFSRSTSRPGARRDRARAGPHSDRSSATGSLPPGRPAAPRSIEPPPGLQPSPVGKQEARPTPTKAVAAAPSRGVLPPIRRGPVARFCIQH